MKLRSSKHMYQSHNQLHRIKPRHFVISAFYSTHMGSCIRNTSIILWPSLCHFRTLLALTSVTLYLSSGYIFIRYVSFSRWTSLDRIYQFVYENSFLLIQENVNKNDCRVSFFRDCEVKQSLGEFICASRFKIPSCTIYVSKFPLEEIHISPK